MQRYQTTGKIDAAYLFSLSGDAVAETCDFIEAHPEVYNDDAKQAIQEAYSDYAHTQKYSWQSLNIADRNALHKLQNLS
jgi:ABC-type taurine transport system substrate-binding protein